MKFQIASLSALYTVYAGLAEQICLQNCGDACEETNEEQTANWEQAGFDTIQDCEAHICSVTYENRDGDFNWDECERGSRELEERKYNHILKMSKHLMNTNLSLKELHKKLQNYGCHCFPGQTRAAGGKGAPVDAQDSLCRDLARCHRCVTMQYGADQVDVDYGKYRFSKIPGDVSCQKTSDRGFPQSHRDLCECDAHFARELAKIWKDSEFNDYFWLHPKHMRQIANGNLVASKFDIDQTCVGNETGKADQCCGAYPLRYPYDSNQKSCCNDNAMYSPVVNECCTSGQVAEIGSC